MADMTPEKQHLLIIKGMITEMPPERREQVEAHAQTIRQLIKGDETGCALMAMALVGAEVAAEP